MSFKLINLNPDFNWKDKLFNTQLALMKIKFYNRKKSLRNSLRKNHSKHIDLYNKENSLVEHIANKLKMKPFITLHFSHKKKENKNYKFINDFR